MERLVALSHSDRFRTMLMLAVGKDE